MPNIENISSVCVNNNDAEKNCDIDLETTPNVQDTVVTSLVADKRANTHNKSPTVTSKEVEGPEDGESSLLVNVPKAALRRNKSIKTSTNYVFVSIGNTPFTLSRHNTSRDAQSRSNTLQFTRTSNAMSSPLLSSSAVKSSTLTSNKSSSSFSNAACPAPDGMLLRVFLPPIRYPSLPTVVPPDEFSSQGSDRDYQNAVNADDATTNLVNHKTDYTNQEKEKVTATNSGSSGVATDHEEGEQIDSHHPIATIGFYDAQQSPPAEAEVAMGRCKALYDYDANMYDELTIRTGMLTLIFLIIYISN